MASLSDDEQSLLGVLLIVCKWQFRSWGMSSGERDRQADCWFPCRNVAVVSRGLDPNWAVGANMKRAGLLSSGVADGRGLGRGVLGLEIQIPSTSTPLSIARAPNGMPSPFVSPLAECLWD